MNTIIVGVTGSIAAYKAAELVSRLRQQGADVHVIMTASAQRLVCPQTFLTLSRNPVVTTLWQDAQWKPAHIELAMVAETLVIAPATANILAKMANGLADDALSTYYLSHTGKVYVAPAMNPRMWKHPATQANCAVLRNRGVQFIGPAEGNVACGEAGPGRMVEVEEILKALEK